MIVEMNLVKVHLLAIYNLIDHNNLRDLNKDKGKYHIHGFCFLQSELRCPPNGFWG